MFDIYFNVSNHHYCNYPLSAEVPAPEFGITLKLVGINGSLASLSPAGGFRKSLKAFCDQHNIRGWIRRTPRVHAEVHVEGTDEKHGHFGRYLFELLEQGIIKNYSPISSLDRVFPNVYTVSVFLILQNSSPHVVNGDYSGHEFDAASRSSADREQFVGAPSPHGSDR